MHSLITICLALILTGCSLLPQKKIVVTRYRYVKIPITDVLKTPCHVKPLPDTVTGDTIAKYIVSLLYEIERCEHKRRALVQMIESYNELSK